MVAHWLLQYLYNLSRRETRSRVMTSTFIVIFAAIFISETIYSNGSIYFGECFISIMSNLNTEEICECAKINSVSLLICMVIGRGLAIGRPKLGSGSATV